MVSCLEISGILSHTSAQSLKIPNLPQNGEEKTLTKMYFTLFCGICCLFNLHVYLGLILLRDSLFSLTLYEFSSAKWYWPFTTSWLCTKNKCKSPGWKNSQFMSIQWSLMDNYKPCHIFMILMWLMSKTLDVIEWSSVSQPTGAVTVLF